MTLDELPLLLTVEEAAHVMRVSRNGAYNAVAEGVIPSIGIGRTIRIPRDAMAAALGSHSRWTTTRRISDSGIRGVRSSVDIAERLPRDSITLLVGCCMPWRLAN